MYNRWSACAPSIVAGSSLDAANASPVRDTQKHAFLPLKGKILNVSEICDSKVIKNQEIQDLMNSIGLELNKKPINIRYGKIVLLVDSDQDGIGHIASLLINFFYKFWPELFTQGKIYLLNAPLRIAEKGGKKSYLYSEEEYYSKNWDGYKVSFFKGLAGLTESDWNYFLNTNPQYVMFKETEKSKEMLDISFGKDADKRKVWMAE